MNAGKGVWKRCAVKCKTILGVQRLLYIWRALSLYWNIKSVLFQPPHSIMPVLHYSTQCNVFYENVSFIISRVSVLVITYFYNVCKFYYDIYYFTNISFVLKTFVFPNLYMATLLSWRLNLLALTIMT